jgi:GPH family glycoside/pentoside/hexuronide:cation symporter
VTPGPERVPLRTKAAYALGDHTLNLSLSIVSIFYVYFLANVAGVRPGPASASLMIARVIDAFADPLMGRLSDTTRWRAGRRRPYFLLGMLPFGASFALLFLDTDGASQLEKFAIYTGAYVLHSLASTVLTVPYVALLPELSLDYRERSSLSSWRSVFSVAGTILAVAVARPLADGFGGGPTGWALMALVVAAWLTLPWLAVWAATWERRGFQRPPEMSFAQGLRALAGHESYRRLVAFYLCSRVSMDLIGFILLFFFSYCLGREKAFEPTFVLLLVAGVASIPLWLRLATRLDKRTVFLIGTAWWLAAQCGFALAQPGWPMALLVAIGALAGVGYVVADFMPWSMLGDVIDEDDLRTGDRREGLYSGFFTFLRKLAGALAVLVGGIALDLSGFVTPLPGQSPADVVQPASAIWTIRILTGPVPLVFLALALALAWGYGIGAREHARIRAEIAARDAAREAAEGAV